MFNPAAALEKLTTDARNSTSWAIVEGAALRGELGADKQRVAIEAWSERYLAARAAGDLAEARRIKDLVFSLVPMD